MEIREQKKLLRKAAKLDFENLSLEYSLDSDKKIFDRLLDSDEYFMAKNIFTFVGVGKEVDTRKIIQHALDNGKEVYVPLCTSKTEMKAIKITSLDRLEKNKLGLYEPRNNSQSISLDRIEFALIPCMYADRKGNRIGYGGGYYDRFFSNFNGEFPAFILAREEMIKEELPVDENDISFKYLLSEKDLYRF